MFRHVILKFNCLRQQAALQRVFAGLPADADFVSAGTFRIAAKTSAKDFFVVL